VISGERYLDLFSTAAAQISVAHNVSDLERILTRKIPKIGFDTFNVAINKPSAREFMTEPTLTAWAREDLQSYDEEYWFKRDPLLAHASTGSKPLLWNTNDWKSWGHDEYHDYVRSAGIKGGLTIPLPSDGSGLSAMTLLRIGDQTPESRAPQTAFVLASLCAARAVAIGAATRLNDDPIKLKRLSGKQMEIMRWVATGKSNIEISIILDLKKRTVDYHVSEILNKLGVSNRAQAATIYTAR